MPLSGVAATSFKSFDFIGILYGQERSGAELMDKIAVALNGRMKDIIEPNQLQEAFVELIPNVYGE
jgi:hypothetical protein